MHSYIPNPPDPNGFSLPPELLPLMEGIAKNVHEMWAYGRIQEGWTYGPVRDDAKKTTPMLVPYEELPESEKAFDRNTANVTLQTILGLGFRIEKEPASE